MKKASVLIAICVVIALVLGSCSASKKCPAYSHNNTEQTENNRG